VWRAPLDNLPLQAARYRPMLSADERARAERFRGPRLQAPFVTTRGILRNLLSHYTGLPADKLQIESNLQGKPFLTDPSALPLQFNVSHTAGMALLAVTIDHPVGIDVETTSRTINASDIAIRYFSSQESAYLTAISPDQRLQAFLTYWTCKEAYLKMRGTGISGGLAQCTIALDPGGVTAHVSLTDAPNPQDNCSLIRISAGQAHIGALAVGWPSIEVSFWEWND
jgi:4'-phosphopantetheinyl transferase